MWQATVLEDVGGNGWEIGVMVGSTVGMWYKKPLKYCICKLSQPVYVTALQFISSAFVIVTHVHKIVTEYVSKYQHNIIMLLPVCAKY